MPVFLGDRTVAKGPYDGPLIRLQIGLEDVDDLKADLSIRTSGFRRRHAGHKSPRSNERQPAVR